MHLETDSYLYANLDYHYNNKNCNGCPING